MPGSLLEAATPTGFTGLLMRVKNLTVFCEAVLVYLDATEAVDWK